MTGAEVVAEPADDQENRADARERILEVVEGNGPVGRSLA